MVVDSLGGVSYINLGTRTCLNDEYNSKLMLHSRSVFSTTTENSPNSVRCGVTQTEGKFSRAFTEALLDLTNRELNAVIKY